MHSSSHAVLHHYWNSCVMWDHTVLPATRQRRRSRNNPSQSWYSIYWPPEGWKAELTWTSWCEYLAQGYKMNRNEQKWAEQGPESITRPPKSKQGNELGESFWPNIVPIETLPITFQYLPTQKNIMSIHILTTHHFGFGVPKESKVKTNEMSTPHSHRHPIGQLK